MWSDEFCILQIGETALIWACVWGKSETVSLLVKAGAKTDIQEKVADLMILHSFSSLP